MSSDEPTTAELVEAWNRPSVQSNPMTIYEEQQAQGDALADRCEQLQAKLDDYGEVTPERLRVDLSDAHHQITVIDTQQGRRDAAASILRGLLSDLRRASDG